MLVRTQYALLGRTWSVSLALVTRSVVGVVVVAGRLALGLVTVLFGMLATAVWTRRRSFSSVRLGGVLSVLQGVK